MTFFDHLWQHAAPMSQGNFGGARQIGLLSIVSLIGALGLVGCEGKLDEKRFRRRAEKSYMKVHPGWTIRDRKPMETLFVRGDQLDLLPVAALFSAYTKSGQSGSDFFEAWEAKQEAMAKARRRTLEQAKSDLLPIVKGASWINVQDLGAIGPKRIQDKIRPWRKKLAKDVYVVLGVPEEKLGYRIASIEEVKTSKEGAEVWLKRAIANLEKKLKVDEITGVKMERKDGRLMAIDMANEDGVSGLVLSDRFRARMIREFGLESLGAAAPIRKVLIIFDPADFVTIKPIRHRTHQLYDTQNHPGFRGLLRLEKSGLSVLEPANPKKKKR